MRTSTHPNLFKKTQGAKPVANKPLRQHPRALMLVNIPRNQIELTSHPFFLAKGFANPKSRPPLYIQGEAPSQVKDCPLPLTRSSCSTVPCPWCCR